MPPEPRGSTDFVGTEPRAGRKSQRAIIASWSAGPRSSPEADADGEAQVPEERGHGFPSVRSAGRPRASVSSRNSAVSRCVIGPTRAVADRPAVDRRDRGELAHRAGAEHFVGAVDLGQREVASPRAGCRARGTARAPTARVMPSGQATVVGVSTTPRSTRKTCVALVSATKPRVSSISASSAPAALASILARIDWIRLLWWILGSRQSGGKRRTLLVISVRPPLVVDRRLVLGQHDQRRPRLVQPRVHAAGDLHAARQRQADVDAVGHVVGGERAADLAR